MRKDKKRAYISIYFVNGRMGRKKGDLTISFDYNSALYKKCKKLGSTEVKKIINIDSYKELVKRARENGRSLGNYVKFKLEKILIENE